MNKETFPFQESFQTAIIKLMLSDENFLDQCSLFLEEKLFDDIYLGWFFDTIVKFWKKYQKVPSIESLNNEISKFSSSDRIPYDAVFQRIISCQYDDYDYIREKLGEFVRNRLFYENAAYYLNEYNAGNDEKAIEGQKKAVEIIESVNFDRDDCVDFDNFNSILDKIRHDTIEKVKIGIPPIDDAMNGGAPKGSLVVFLGVTNVGKSVIMVNAACNIMRQGKKVLFIDLEMSEYETIPRFLGCLTGITCGRIVMPEKFLTEEEKSKIREAREFMKLHLALKIEKEEIRYIEDLSAFCAKKKRMFDYDAVVVDYGMKLVSRDRYNGNYERFGAIYERLGRIGMTNKAVMITAAQGNRAARKNTRHSNIQTNLVRLEDMADSQWINNNAGYIITITKSERDEANNRIKFLLDKQRIGPTNIAVQYNNTNFSAAQVFTPNIEFEKFNPYEEVKEDE